MEPNRFMIISIQLTPDGQANWKLKIDVVADIINKII